MSAVATVLVPSRLPSDVSERVSRFAAALRDEVAAPLFSGHDPVAFLRSLDDFLATGTALRMRWLTSASALPEGMRHDTLNEWLRPPPPEVLDDLQARASALLGAERSFQLQRAFALSFTDAVEGGAAVLGRWRSPGDVRSRLVEFARIAESSATHDVLAIAWMMVLFGDVPEPRPEVADAAATALLRLTADRLDALRLAVGGEIASPSGALDDAELAPSWLGEHPTLVASLFALTGLALDEPDCTRVVLRVRPDPEEPGASIAEVRLQTTRDPDALLDQVQSRALRAGALGVLVDDRGGLIAVTSERVAAL